MSNTPDLPPPVPPTVIPPVVATLDPDLANAYLAGVPGVVQAVANGMTTNAMIVNDLIRTGASMAGMPSAIVQMVSERQKEIDAQREVENERVRKLAAGVLGAAMVATNANAGMYYGGEAPSRDYVTNPPSSAEFSLMNDAEKALWRAGVLAITADRWANLSTEQRNQTTTLAVQDAQETGQKVGLTMGQLLARARDDAELGADGIERLKALKAVNKNVDDWLASNPGKTVQDYAEYLACTNTGLSDAQKRYAVEAFGIKDASSDAERARAASEPAMNAAATGQIAEQLASTQEIVGATQKSTEKLAAIAVAQETPGLNGSVPVAPAATTAVVEGDNAMMGGRASSSEQIRAAGTDNLAAGATVDTQVAKAELQTARPDDYGNEDTAPRKPSIVASNLGNGPDSKLAQLGAPAEAANDPKAPVAEPERPRVASLSQGMGA